MNEKDIFLAALDIDDPDERLEYLDAACADDAELLHNVEELLAAHASADTFLGKAVAAEQRDDRDSTEFLKDVPSELLSFLKPVDEDSLGKVDHYQVLSHVGSGGMGVVFKAMDTSLRRIVALKVLAPQVASSGAARQRFIREAQAAAAVTHENVVAIHAVEGKRTVPYLVMQFIAGCSLEDKIRKQGPLPPREVLRIGLQIARGLAAAHAQGLIHRDIKPANILLENGVERVKLTDFGLARAVDDASLTQSGVIAGTPMYMAPEQARGEAIDQRADLFSFGSVLYTMCTGRPPFRAGGAVAVLKRVCDDAPRPIREVNPEIPPGLSNVVDRLLAKSRGERLQSAAEVGDILERQLAQLQQAGVPSSDRLPVPEPVRPRARLRVLRAVGVLALLVGVGVLVSANWPRGENHADILGAPVQVDRPVPVALELQRDNIPPELLAAVGEGDASKAPKELVAVLNDPLRPASALNGLALSPDGRTLAAGGDDHVVRLWDLQTRKLLHRLREHTNRVWSLAFSPDGKRLVSGSFDRTLIVWDPVAGQQLKVIGEHARECAQVVFAPDGHLLAAGGEQGDIRFWHTSNFQPRRALRPHQGSVRALAFSPDGKRLASAGPDRTVRVSELESGRLLHTFELNAEPERGSAIAVAFSPDGGSLAWTMSYSSSTLHVVDLESKRERICTGHLDSLGGLAWHPKLPLIATGSTDGTLRYWRWDGDQVYYSVVGPGPFGKHVNSVAFTPDGKYLITANESGLVTVLLVPAMESIATPMTQP